MSYRVLMIKNLLSLDEEASVFSAFEGLKDEDILFKSVRKPRLFEVLVDRYTEAFRNKVRSVIGNREEIDDIVQETFVKIYLNARRFKVQEGATFKSWGYKILLNTTFTRYQKLKKDGEATVHIEQEFFDALPDKKPEFEMTDLVASVISRMPTHLGRILKLHFLDGMPQKEIARLEDISISAVKTRIHRAKKEYRKIDKTLHINTK